MIDVVEEGVQSIDALDRAALQDRPFVGAENAGNDVEGDQAFAALVLAINGEGDPETPEQQICLLVFLAQTVDGLVRQPGRIIPVSVPNVAVSGVHLVEKAGFFLV